MLLKEKKIKKIISLNCGSSSVKLSVFNFNLQAACGVFSRKGKKCVPSSDLLSQADLALDRVLSCSIEEIGTEHGSFRLKTKFRSKNKDKNNRYKDTENAVEKEENINKSFAGHEEALHYIFSKAGLLKIIKADVVVHRYVHGGNRYIEPLLVGESDVKKLAGLNGLAPLHNPANLKGLEIMKSLLPAAKQVCIFDTAFHRSIPLYARLYPIPIEYYEKFKIEKYGFHGISYSFISGLLRIFDKKIKKTIICHIGNGASVCAVKNGKSADTSMGYTPLEGLMMGTRCGNIDPEVPFIFKKRLNLTDEETARILNKKSGLLGISKKTYDFKELVKQKDKYSELALKMYAYRIVKFIGQYAAVLNGFDALVFTGGIGENSDWLRKEVCSRLSYLGVKIDEEKNAAAAELFRSFEALTSGMPDVENSVKLISADRTDGAGRAGNSGGRIKVFAVHTDEELQMALESMKFMA